MTRVQRFIDYKKLGEGEAALISKPSNVFYLSGYTGEGMLLITKQTQAIITDFRYVEQAGQESPDFRVVSVEGGISHLQRAQEICETEFIEILWFEDDELTVRAYEKAAAIFEGIALTGLSNETEKLRRIKDSDELKCIEYACKISGETFERILPQIREGMTEKELARLLEFDMLEHGADKMGFAVIAAAGVNGSKPHAVPGEYQIKRGDMITMDFGASYRGYTADMTRTVALGKPSDEMRKIYGIVQKAQEMAQDAVMAGASCAAIDAIARDYIYSMGYEGRFGHGLGHSLGIDIHEEPRLSAMSEDVLEVNQLVTVEPGIYLPGIGGVRIENTVLVQNGGYRSLITPTRDLMIL